MIQIELAELVVFKIMFGSMQERLDFFISDEVLSKLDVKTIKKIVQARVDSSHTDQYALYDKNAGFGKNQLTEVIMFLQYLAYNRHKSPHSEEIATYVFDKLFEIITHDFF